jgi:hypothetical protein
MIKTNYLATKKEHFKLVISNNTRQIHPLMTP